MKVYISGAISGFDICERKKAFADAGKFLKEQFYSPISPFMNGLGDYAPYCEHMKADIRMLLDCDAIYMLKGWESSEGAKVEYRVAQSCGLKIMFEGND